MLMALPSDEAYVVNRGWEERRPIESEFDATVLSKGLARGSHDLSLAEETESS